LLDEFPKIPQFAGSELLHALMTALPEKPSLEKPPTLADLGRILGLSKRAVSQALNERQGTVKVSAATRQRVQSLAKQMGYRPNFAAASLTTGRTGQFGILTPISRMHVHAIRLASAVDAFAKLGISPIVVYSGAKSEEAQDSTLLALIGGRIDGILLLNRQAHFSEAHVSELRRFGTAVVQVGSTLASLDTFHYLTDRTQAFGLVFDHLIEQGFRRIGAMVGNQTGSSGSNQRSIAGTQTRMAILEAANMIRNRGVDISLQIHDLDPDAVVSNDPHPLYSAGYYCMRKLIDDQQVPEVLVCQVDSWAFGAMRACAEAGIRIPHDMAITGYGNEPVCSATYHPLTSIDEPFDSMCDAAVQEIVHSVRENRPIEVRSVVMPCQLIVRQSSLRPEMNSQQVESQA